MKIETTNVLRLPTLRITPETIPEYRHVVAEMWQIMYDNKGIGLAATQVGLPLSLAVIDVGDGWPLVLFNPKIIVHDGRRLCAEGCLSLPGETYKVYRAKTVEVEYTDLDGDTFRVRTRKTLLGQVLEHEIAHLSGILIDGKSSR